MGVSGQRALQTVGTNESPPPCSPHFRRPPPAPCPSEGRDESARGEVSAGVEEQEEDDDERRLVIFVPSDQAVALQDFPDFRTSV